MVEPEELHRSGGRLLRMGDNRNESMDARYWKNLHVYKTKYGESSVPLLAGHTLKHMQTVDGTDRCRHSFCLRKELP